jgi:glutaredoxin
MCFFDAASELDLTNRGICFFVATAELDLTQEDSLTQMKRSRIEESNSSTGWRCPHCHSTRRVLFLVSEKFLKGFGLRPSGNGDMSFAELGSFSSGVLSSVTTT